MNRITTAMGRNFRKEDVTFKYARKQSEIENEIEHVEEQVPEVKAPVSLTPEQVIEFYKTKIKVAYDSNEKRLYSQTITWIKELQTIKKEFLALKEKEIARSKNEEDNIDDIIEDNDSAKDTI